MSEERSWAEDTVELGAVDRRAPSEPKAAPLPRRGQGRRGAATAIGVTGAAMIVFSLLGGGGDGRDRREAKAEPERRATVETETAIPSQPSYRRPVERQAGSFAVGLARRVPKPPKPKPAPAPPPAAPEAVPTYEPVPEPVAEPAPTPPAPEASAAPALETPAAVEFGM